MKLPNSYGSVIKLGGKRRKPYAVRMRNGRNTENRLRTRLVIPRGEIMRLLFIISASCMTANLFPSGQMICSNA